jgi:Fic family protein
LALLSSHNPAAEAITEANFCRLQETADNLILGATAGGAHFALCEDHIRALHRIAMDGLKENAGDYRKRPVFITLSSHTPPRWDEVRALMSSLCRYVNENWVNRDVIHLCAFVFWRLCWIHPFQDGNGRVARTLCNIIFGIKEPLLAKPFITTKILRSHGFGNSYLENAHQVFFETRCVDKAMRPIEQWFGQMLMGG